MGVSWLWLDRAGKGWDQGADSVRHVVRSRWPGYVPQVICEQIFLNRSGGLVRFFQRHPHPRISVGFGLGGGDEIGIASRSVVL